VRFDRTEDELATDALDLLVDMDGSGNRSVTAVII
jgi:hypothetical protein